MRWRRFRSRCAAYARSEPAGTRLVYGALALTTVANSSVLLAYSYTTSTERAFMLLAGITGWVAVIALGWTRGRLPTKAVVTAIAATMLFAAATPSHQSKDVFSYAMYGRMVTEHHANPYDNYPVHFEGDPMRRHVSAVWQRTPDIYGPVFTGVMAALAPVIGESTFLTHFLYQLIALIAVGVLLWLLWRRTRNPTVVAFVGLSPLASISVVNGGHPDALVALAFLIAFFLALERRVALCALALAFGAAINFSVIVAAVAVGAWALWRWSKRELATFAAITLGLGAVPYVLLNGWSKNAHEHQQLISRQSIWNPLASALTHTGPISFASFDIGQVREFMPNVTTLAAGILLVAVLWRHSRRATPALAIASALTVFLVTSPWVMPWYGFAAFPFLAMRRPSLLSWSVGIYSVLILIGDQFPSLSSLTIGTFAHTLFETLVPVVACTAAVIALFLNPDGHDRELSTDVDLVDTEMARSTPAFA